MMHVECKLITAFSKQYHIYIILSSYLLDKSELCYMFWLFYTFFIVIYGYFGLLALAKSMLARIVDKEG